MNELRWSEKLMAPNQIPKYCNKYGKMMTSNEFIHAYLRNLMSDRQLNLLHPRFKLALRQNIKVVGSTSGKRGSQRRIVTYKFRFAKRKLLKSLKPKILY